MVSSFKIVRMLLYVRCVHSCQRNANKNLSYMLQTNLLTGFKTALHLNNYGQTLNLATGPWFFSSPVRYLGKTKPTIRRVNRYKVLLKTLRSALCFKTFQNTLASLTNIHINQREHLVKGIAYNNCAEFNQRFKMSLGKATLRLMCNCEKNVGIGKIFEIRISRFLPIDMAFRIEMSRTSWNLQSEIFLSK